MKTAKAPRMFVTTVTAAATGFAAAAVIAPSLAMAQSHATALGQVSLSLTKASGTPTQVRTTGFGSGIGFRGTEDLGGGLSAYFHIENRFDADTGTAIDPFWTEKTLVGLVGGFGKVEFGRFGNAYDAILGLADPFGDTVANMLHKAALGETKWANSIGYYSPGFGPVSVAFTVSTKEAPNIHNGCALNMRFVQSPLAVGFGVVRNGTNKGRSVALAGNYDFGTAKLHAGYTQSSNAGTARNYQLGVGVPVSATGIVKVAFSNYSEQTQANPDLTDRKVGLGYWHSMSKRTLLFVDVSRLNRKTGSAGSGTNALDVGILHKF